MRRGRDRETDTDTQTAVTNIHFASATPHAKCNKFQAIAQATGKARRPNIERRWRGTNSSWQLAKRRWTLVVEQRLLSQPTCDLVVQFSKKAATYRATRHWKTNRKSYVVWEQYTNDLGGHLAVWSLSNSNTSGNTASCIDNDMFTYESESARGLSRLKDFSMSPAITYTASLKVVIYRKLCKIETSLLQTTCMASRIAAIPMTLSDRHSPIVRLFKWDFLYNSAADDKILIAIARRAVLKN